MSFVGKWFSFGKDPSFDEGIRSYEKRAFAAALSEFKASLTNSKDRATTERAKNYVAGCLGKLAREFADKNPPKAMEYVAEALTLRPGFADLWLLFARLQMKQGLFPDAKRSTERALSINPKYGAGFVMLGTLQYARGEHELGLDSVREGIRIDPRLDEQSLKGAELAHNEQSYDLALSRLQNVQPCTSDANDLVNQGDGFAKLGEWEHAENCYRHALGLAPDYADIRSKHGQALMELGTLDEAIDEFNLAIAANADYADAYALLGITYRRKDDETLAIQSFEQALRIDPNHPIASQEILYRRK